MSLLETALTLLRRPVETEGEPPGRRKAPGPTDPLTEADLTEVLSRLIRERVEAETTLAGAADQREALLMTPGSDDQIFQLAAAIDRANLTLERLDRLEPDLRERLGQVKYYNRGARWVADRDRAAAGFEQFITAIKAYETARSQWAQAWNGLLEKWPTAGDIMPWMPKLDGSSGAYAGDVEIFRNRVIVLSEPPRAAYHTLAQAIDYARKFGHAPDGLPGDWVAECEMAIGDSVPVQILVSSLDGEARPLDKGAIVTMTYDDARRAVTNGRARFADS
jgi:hypothetical protein